MLRVPRVLARSLEENTVALEHRMARARIKHGISILPFDVISEILASNRPTLKEAVELSHVSSHFRQAILSTPLIWASYALHPCMSSEQIVSLANRSGTRSLAARIRPRLGIEDWDKRVEHILSFSTRLKRLVIENIDDASALSLQVHHSNLLMPIIDELSIDCSRFVFCVHFYASWSLRNVKRLEVTNFIPKPVFGQHLSSCHIKFTQMFDVEFLLRFIGSLSLKDLKIELVDISEAGIDIEELAGVDISSITSYSFHVIGQTSNMFARSVLCTISPPKVVEMSLSIVYPGYPEGGAESLTWSQREYLLDPLQKFSMLKILNLHFSGPAFEYAMCFNILFLGVPDSVENFRLEAPGHILDLGRFGPIENAPQLRTLCFCNCGGVESRFLRKVRRQLLRNGVPLERLEIIGCRPLIEEKDLRGDFPTLEIVWAP
ncbi:hypothetical protein DFH11DRAFT_1639990 [Phellopilus nigrolimitatus]|nr:hypothetical protein DFH11DRAFT_1639990 [Phellopilus nigrolimitatus]